MVYQLWRGGRWYLGEVGEVGDEITLGTSPKVKEIHRHLLSEISALVEGSVVEYSKNRPETFLPSDHFVTPVIRSGKLHRTRSIYPLGSGKSSK